MCVTGALAQAKAVSYIQYVVESDWGFMEGLIRWGGLGLDQVILEGGEEEALEWAFSRAYSRATISDDPCSFFLIL